MHKLATSIGLFLCFAVAFQSCSPDPDPPKPVTSSAGDLLIANEGNFGWGEGSLSIYNPTEETIQNNAFKNVNAESMGNVFQSINHIANRYYFVMNNSNKIVLTNDSFEKVNSIENLTSPRYIYPVSNSTAYVTDLYANAVHIIDIKAEQKIGEIALPGWSEGGVLVNNEFWVCNMERKYVYIIDINTNSLKDSVEVGYASQSIVLSNDSILYVLCQGDESKNETAALVSINPKTKSRTEFKPLTGKPSRLQYYAKENKLYFLNEDVYETDASLKSIPASIIDKENSTFYGLTVNQENGEIYVSDALDYSSESDIYRYSNNGELLHQFKAGIIAGEFWWRK